MAFMGESAVNNYPHRQKLPFPKEAGVLSLLNTKSKLKFHVAVLQKICKVPGIK